MARERSATACAPRWRSASARRRARSSGGERRSGSPEIANEQNATPTLPTSDEITGSTAPAMTRGSVMTRARGGARRPRRRAAASSGRLQAADAGLDLGLRLRADGRLEHAASAAGEDDRGADDDAVLVRDRGIVVVPDRELPG